LQPLTEANLLALGIAPRVGAHKAGWLPVFIGVAAFFIVFFLVVCFVRQYTKTRWGRKEAGLSDYTDKARDIALDVWNVSSQGTIMQARNFSDGIRSLKELMLDEGKGEKQVPIDPFDPSKGTQNWLGDDDILLVSRVCVYVRVCECVCVCVCVCV
jgi:hypothetical protein